MTDLMQRVERTAKKLGLGSYELTALAAEFAEVRREAIEECMTVLYERDDVGQPIIEAIRALLPAAQKEETS